MLRRLHPEIVAKTRTCMEDLGGDVRTDPETDLLHVNNEFRVSLVIARCIQRATGHQSWKVRLDAGLSPDLTVAVRLTPDNNAPLDYYLLPHIDLVAPRIRLLEHNPIELDNFRFDSLDYLYGMAARMQLRSAA
ncbi:hypothetical protein G7048_11995 [Diaphorobacter sp. HDW4B]|uniref:hypothetical protein n=1 Tax=Diaphorobacter sp. HDW4B TaxID=2714925 RepID=UPI0014094A29|nr:hypothetical protein [Diaphorobacter sp. HDW4B]QIL71018.1 hypothetical protein G7048_11995 [Diaphorobacter sp. HDW4B]